MGILMGFVVIMNLIFIVGAIFDLFEYVVDLAVGNITKKEALKTLIIMLALIIIWFYVL